VKTSRHQNVARRKRRIERRLRPKTWKAQPTPMYRASNIQYEHSDRVRGLASGGIGAMHRSAQHTVRGGRVEGRRGDVQERPICYRPFRLTVPHSPLHHSVSDPRHLEPDRRVSRIQLAATASSNEVMGPFNWCAPSRSRTRGGSPEKGPTIRTRCCYSTASSRIPCACVAGPRIASPCAPRGIAPC
jgi:hypothetical protein